MHYKEYEQLTRKRTAVRVAREVAVAEPVCFLAKAPELTYPHHPLFPSVCQRP